MYEQFRLVLQPDFVILPHARCQLRTRYLGVPGVGRLPVMEADYPEHLLAREPAPR
jgi:hypothetical protein